MQIFTNVSKILILAVLSCSLMMAVLCDDIHVTEMVLKNPSIEHLETSSVKAVNSIWSSISSEFTLDHKAQSSQVKAEIRKLLADRAKLYSILKAAGPYIYYIHQQTQTRRLPAEIALIPVIESEFNPNDHSKKGATGLWQLMPGTAHELGVKVKSSYDGRRNVMASTRAALAYFNDLGNSFKGDWYLAIAAYNCGQGRVQSVQRRSGIHDFWDLKLPRETRDYVPKLLAVAAIVKNPEKYGVQLPPINNEPYFTEVKFKKSVNLGQVAKSSGVSIETLHTLNPDFNHGVEPNKGSYNVLVPVQKVPVVRAQLADRIVLS